MVSRRGTKARATTWFDRKVGVDVGSGSTALLALLPQAEDLEGFTLARTLVGISL